MANFRNGGKSSQDPQTLPGRERARGGRQELAATRSDGLSSPMQFASDNWAGAAPAIIHALAEEAGRFGKPYGEGPVDRAVEEGFSALFEREVAVFLVGTGSAANGLALASANRPGGVVMCHRESHVVEDECGGVEYLTGGGRLVGLPGAHGKIDPAELSPALARFTGGFVHAGQAMAVSITQQTEAGTVYTPEEVAAIAGIARDAGVPLHMDGARFANAVAHLGVSPAEITWKSGVDILSFGGTKNGCLGAEAIVVFDPGRAQDMPYLRKRAGQLFSKSRFISAQFHRYLEEGLWLDLARHANRMADRLRDAIRTCDGAREAWPTQGNEVFAVLSSATVDTLRNAGAQFYDWAAPADLVLQPGEILVRLVASFATTDEEVAAFAKGLGR